MTGRGQTSVMSLKLWFPPLQKRWFSCEAVYKIIAANTGVFGKDYAAMNKKGSLTGSS